MADFYRVKLDVFEGPLDLLLHLIKKNEVEIADIPIAMVTEQYMAYLELMRDLSLDVAGEFLVMAATLMLIKSRMLLPSSEDGDEEEEADPRANLVRQLLEYQRYREAGLALAERPLLNRDIFVRDATPDLPDDTTPADMPRLKVTVWELLEAFRAVLQRARPELVHEVITEQVSLRDRARELLQTLRAVRCLEFESLFDADVTRFDVVVTFLALLELVKMGAVRATQDALWGRIVIELAVDDVDAVSFGALDEYDGESFKRQASSVEPEEHGVSDEPDPPQRTS
jgi:segregation and condensation protein A